MVVFYILLNKVHFAKCILLFVERVNHPFLCHPTDYGSKSKVNSMDVVPHICAKVCCLCPIKKRNGQIFSRMYFREDGSAGSICC